MSKKQLSHLIFLASGIRLGGNFFIFIVLAEQNGMQA